MLLKTFIKTKILGLAVFLSIFFTPFCQANDTLKTIDQVTFGPEWAFSIDDFVTHTGTTNMGVRDSYKENYLDTVKTIHHPNVADVNSQSKTITLAEETPKHGYWTLNIGSDPGVIEVQSTPATFEEFLRRAPVIQEVLFDTMARIGVGPQEFRGGGHIHIGPQAFQKKPKLLRNFVVDYYNHGGLAEGGLNFDKQNSASAAFYSKEKKAKLRDIIQRFDSGQLRTFDELYEALHSLGKASIRYNDQFKTVEIRAIRPQQSMNDFINLIQLFRSRMRYLAKHSAPIDLDDLEPTRTSIQAIEEYYRYVTESGLAWEDYRHFVMPHWQNKGADLDVFESKLKAGELSVKPQKKQCIQHFINIMRSKF